MEYTIAIQSQPIIHFFSICILFIYLETLSSKLDYDSYYDPKIEWVYAFVLFSKLKYLHCLFLRTLYKKFHSWYQIIKPFQIRCVSTFKKVLEQITILSNWYFNIDKSYLYSSLNNITNLYYEDYKKPILKTIYLN